MAQVEVVLEAPVDWIKPWTWEKDLQDFCNLDLFPIDINCTPV